MANVAPGMSCLDVGCGPGEVMRLMGDVVGSDGSVTGVDEDGKLGREALGALKATTKSEFHFVEGDVEAMDTMPGEPFDFVSARKERNFHGVSLAVAHVTGMAAALLATGVAKSELAERLGHQ